MSVIAKRSSQEEATHLYGLEVLASYPKCAESEPKPGDETSLLLPPGRIVHDQRAGTELHS